MTAPTLKETLDADYQSGGAFFPVDSNSDPTEFAESVEFWPKGVEDDKTTIKTAFVFSDNEEGSREVQGDGRVLYNQDGAALRHTIMIEVPAATAVRDVQPLQKPDQFKWNDKLYNVKRITGRDDQSMTVVCVRKVMLREKRGKHHG